MAFAPHGLREALMKVRRHTVKLTRACDDWYEDEAPWYETGSAYELSDDSPRFHSVSLAAHQAMSIKPAEPIGFHRPKG